MPKKIPNTVSEEPTATRGNGSISVPSGATLEPIMP